MASTITDGESLLGTELNPAKGDIKLKPLSDHTSNAPPTPSLVMKIGRVLDMFYNCDTSAMAGFADEASNCVGETVTLNNAIECGKAAAECDLERMEDTGLICNIPGDMESLQEELIGSRNELSPRSLAATEFTDGIPSMVMKRENDTVCDELTLDGALLAMERREELETLRASGVSALDVKRDSHSSDDSSKGGVSVRRRSFRRLFGKKDKDKSSATKRVVNEKREGSLRKFRTALMPPRTAKALKPMKMAE